VRDAYTSAREPDCQGNFRGGVCASYLLHAAVVHAKEFEKLARLARPALMRWQPFALQQALK
jgi:hypothetical protein